MQPILLTATAEEVTIEESEAVSAVILDDGLPPPTHVQVQYWRELCGAISATGGCGMTDEGWSADLKPSDMLPMANAKGLRRRRTWHPIT